MVWGPPGHSGMHEVTRCSKPTGLFVCCHLIRETRVNYFQEQRESPRPLQGTPALPEPTGDWSGITHRGMAASSPAAFISSMDSLWLLPGVPRRSLRIPVWGTRHIAPRRGAPLCLGLPEPAADAQRPGEGASGAHARAERARTREFTGHSCRHSPGTHAGARWALMQNQTGRSHANWVLMHDLMRCSGVKYPGAGARMNGRPRRDQPGAPACIFWALMDLSGAHARTN